ncbi:hypothetical protein [Sphingomonas sp.]|uniref:hypothetical protein n=1 Tax=Sphingomonas sp. TaxID=28214 RepID=UPI0025D259CB|nr:hypothetical protein [Sphingomonas sp.]
MRYSLLIAVMLSACSAKEQAGPAPGTFAGAGRDRLCIAGEGELLRAGLITYAAQGDANCSMAGKLERKGEAWVLIPRGEGECQLALTVDQSGARIASVPGACSYYCGPGASLAGRSFKRDSKAAQAIDFAGSKLC